MNKKNIILVCTIVVAMCLFAGAFFVLKTSSNNDENISIPVDKKHAESRISKRFVSEKLNDKNMISKDIQKETFDSNIKKQSIKMYDNLPDNMLPLSGITELSGVSEDISKQLEKIVENSNAIYMLKKHGGKIFMIVDNPENTRHGIDFIEISAQNGHKIRTNFGSNGKIKDTDNEIWEYDKNSEEQIPIRHTVFDKNGDVEYVETWNYDDNPIKYEKKDEEGRVIALKKETVENGTNMRIENLLYDKEGNTKLNVTAVYEGEDLKRFTYYDADNLSNSVSMHNEYENGQKKEEILYTSDLKVKNIYKPEYKDGQRIEITVFDENNNEQAKYTNLAE